jgi:hypothetical protein
LNGRGPAKPGRETAQRAKRAALTDSAKGGGTITPRRREGIGRAPPQRVADAPQRADREPRLERNAAAPRRARRRSAAARRLHRSANAERTRGARRGRLQPATPPGGPSCSLTSYLQRAPRNLWWRAPPLRLARPLSLPTPLSPAVPPTRSHLGGATYHVRFPPRLCGALSAHPVRRASPVSHLYGALHGERDPPGRAPLLPALPGRRSHRLPRVPALLGSLRLPAGEGRSDWPIRYVTGEQRRSAISEPVPAGQRHIEGQSEASAAQLPPKPSRAALPVLLGPRRATWVARWAGEPLVGDALTAGSGGVVVRVDSLNSDQRSSGATPGALATHF